MNLICPAPSFNPSDYFSSFLQEDSAFYGDILSQAVDLQEPAVLLEYLEKKEYLETASLIASAALTQFRHTADSKGKYGQVFPIRSELLAYAMKLAKNETVLELAGADGKNGILLALAGAKKAYVNDILSEEMDIFNRIRQSLPKEVSSKLTGIEGDCFDLLQLEPTLEESCGLVLCNNFMHFLNDQQIEQLIDLLKTVLKINGVAIITVNGKTGFEAHLSADPHHTAFEQTYCISDAYDSSFSNGAQQLGLMEKAISGEKISPDFTNVVFYRKYPFIHEWILLESEANKLTFDELNFAAQVMRQQAHIIQNIQDGAIRILKTTVRSFSEEDLRELFESHEFKVESTFRDEMYNRVVAIIRR